MAQKRKCYDISFKLKAIECAEKESKEAAAHVTKGSGECMVGNKRQPGLDAGPCLNARVRGVLKEINTRASIPGSTVHCYI